MMLAHSASLSLFPSHVLYLNLKMIQPSNTKCSFAGAVVFKPLTTILNGGLQEHTILLRQGRAKVNQSALCEAVERWLGPTKMVWSLQLPAHHSAL